MAQETALRQHGWIKIQSLEEAARFHLPTPALKYYKHSEILPYICLQVWRFGYICKMLLKYRQRPIPEARTTQLIMFTGIACRCSEEPQAAICSVCCLA